MPDMEAFDAPAREAGLHPPPAHQHARLQALVTLNDPQWLEVRSRRLAENAARAARLGSGPRYGTIWAGSSSPILDKEGDRELLTQELGKFQAAYRGQPAAPKELIAVGRIQAQSEDTPLNRNWPRGCWFPARPSTSTLPLNK